MKTTNVREESRELTLKEKLIRVMGERLCKMAVGLKSCRLVPLYEPEVPLEFFDEPMN
ncbi:MAG: hypothetical protein FWE90_11680 [Defluviitaleaceae bacterium]|nr:hypothetical protein [Defluviitaleaceae bacterium]